MATIDKCEMLEVMRNHIRMIDEKTNDLLNIADVLEEHGVNVKHEGRYLNPVSTIRVKVDVIWDEVQMIQHEVMAYVIER